MWLSVCRLSRTSLPRLCTCVLDTPKAGPLRAVRAVRRLLMEEYRLQDHLSILRSVCFMEAGDAAAALTDGLCRAAESAAAGGPSLTDGVAQNAFEEAVKVI
jgi:hypothetical protein